MKTIEERIAELSPDKREWLRKIQAGMFVGDSIGDISKCAKLGGLYHLSPPQRRLWMLDKLDPSNPVYNISSLYYLRGTLDIDAL